MAETSPLWTPRESQVAASAMTALRLWCADKHGLDLADHAAFHQWSIAERGAFWTAVWDYCGVKGSKGIRDLIDGDDMLAARFSRMPS
jgi:acetoacetyl-CoA synthetase